MSHRIIGADYCPYCVKVKQYFESNHIAHEWVDSETPEGAKLREVESKKHNYNTIPMVYINDQFVGGCSDFFAKNGKEFSKL